MSISNIIIFGKNGQVGSNLVKIFSAEKNFNVTSFSSSDIDFSQPQILENFLNNLKIIPDFIINAAAYTAVDKAEEEKELCDLINHQAPAIIAKYAAKKDVIFIHYSTDYVFDGSGNLPFEENNQKNLNPLNIYGRTKLLGEKAIIDSACKYIILRTSWVYDDNGKNFANSIIKLAKEREVLTIVSDQIGSPTSAKSIAFHSLEIVKKLQNWPNNFPSGIYHLVNNRFISWYEFAIEIVEFLRKNKVVLTTKEIKEIKTSDYKTAATRPLNSRLSCKKIQDVFGIKIKSEKYENNSYGI